METRGIVRDSTKSPCAYVVDLADDTALSRIRTHLRPTGETNITAGKSQSITLDAEPSLPPGKAPSQVNSPLQST